MIDDFIDIVGVQFPVSRIVLGGAFGERSDADSFCILDRFMELGGNAIETAHAYANGAAEEQIGRWLSDRACRDRVMLITKVCHPSAGELASIADFDDELSISLERLGVDKVDIVLLHRDPRTIPASRVLEAIEHCRARGSFAAYGISNIHGDRLAEFDCAEALNVPPLAVISNYFGLAQQASPPWPGTVQLDESGQQWLRKHKSALLCWSALAQGWFAHRHLPAEYEAVYDTPSNRARRQRADTLASKRGASGLQVALAYAFAAPFALLASVGPRSTNELDEVIAALSLRLNKMECAFLQESNDAA